MFESKKAKIETPMTPQRLESYALFLLVRQDYSAKRITEKLALKYPPRLFGDSEQVISSLIEKLKNSGYINDERFLSSILSSLLAQNIGESKIKQRLTSKGFCSDSIKNAMSQLRESDENDFFSKALAFKIRKYGDAPIMDKALAQKALRTLVSKGFSFSDSQKAIKHTPPEY